VKHVHMLKSSAAVLAVLAVLACYQWLDGKSNSLVLEQPIAIALSHPCPDLGSPEPERWLKLAHKFRPAEPIKTLPDLLHHIGNGFLIQMPDHSDNITRMRLLTDLLDGTLSPQYQPKTAWLFRGIDSRPHMSQRVDEGAEGHPSQLLADFAALGIRTSRIVRSGETSVSIAELVRSLKEDFHLEGEIEWKAIALARYAPTKASWVNRWGKAFDFDTIVSNLLQRMPGQGSCRGTHILQALVVIWRVDALNPILSGSSRDAIRRRLATTVVQLQTGQRDEGYWAPDWPTPHPNRSDFSQDHLLFSMDQLALVTGHHLEWLDMLDDKFALPVATHQAALGWCVRTLERVTAHSVAEYLCAYSHCFRAVTRDISPEAWSGERGVR